MTRSRIAVDLGEITNSCFVVMPFSAVFESEYQKVIKPAIESVGLKCVRGDEIYTRQAIVEDIWHSIREARVVVAPDGHFKLLHLWTPKVLQAERRKL